MSSQLIEVQQNMKTRLRDMIALLGRIFTIVGTSSNQDRDEDQAGRAQAMSRAQATGGSQSAGGTQADGAQANETQADRA